MLAGVAAPGVSLPCDLGDGGPRVRERIDRRAWSGVLEQVAAGGLGGLVVLRTGHVGGRVLASTGTGTLSFRVDPQLGLLFVAELADGPLERLIRSRADGLGVPVSIGFRPVQSSVVRWSNGPVRSVEQLRLDHVALVGVDEQRRAAYPGARAFAGPVGSAEKLLERGREWALANGWRLV